MRFDALPALGLLAALAACDDGISPGGRNPAALRVVSGSHLTGPVGSPLALVVEVRGADTLPLPGVRVDFRVDAGDAELSHSSRETQPDGSATVHAFPRTPGTILVTASVFSSGLAVTFLLAGEGSPEAPSCQGANTLTLVPGEVRAGLGGGGICLGGTSSGATYALVAFNSTQSAAAGPFTIELRASGVGAPAAARSVAGASLIQLPQRGDMAGGFAAALRSLPLQSRAVVPEVGSERLFTAPCGAGCSPAVRTGRLVLVSSTALMYEDVSNPAGGFSDADYREIAASFDTLWNPIDTLNFRAPADIDDNQRVILFFTGAMNQSVASHALHPRVVFEPCDLFLRSDVRPGSRTCATSNESEMLYVGIPDPSAPSGSTFSRSELVAALPRETVHAYAHLINVSRRLAADPARILESSWLDEALGLIAEELLFQRVSARNSRENLDALNLSLTAQSLDAFRAYQLRNIENYRSFLGQASASSPVLDIGSTNSRGAAWSLLRYLVDRRGGADYEAWTLLVNTADTGFTNLEKVFGATLPLQMRDWGTSLLVDDLFAAALQFRQLSWNYRSIFAAMDVTPFPLQPFVIPEQGVVSRSIAPLAAAHFVVSVAPGGVGSVRWSGSNGGTIAAVMQWSIVRLD